jgi:hypothetical protein
VSLLFCSSPRHQAVAAPSRLERLHCRRSKCATCHHKWCQHPQDRAMPRRPPEESPPPLSTSAVPPCVPPHRPAAFNPEPHRVHTPELPTGSASLADHATSLLDHLSVPPTLISPSSRCTTMEGPLWYAFIPPQPQYRSTAPLGYARPPPRRSSPPALTGFWPEPAGTTTWAPGSPALLFPLLVGCQPVLAGPAWLGRLVVARRNNVVSLFPMDLV